MNYELDELGLNTFLEEFIEKLGIETKSLQKDLELIKKIDDQCETLLIEIEELESDLYREVEKKITSKSIGMSVKDMLMNEPQYLEYKSKYERAIALSEEKIQVSQRIKQMMENAYNVVSTKYQDYSQKYNQLRNARKEYKFVALPKRIKKKEGEQSSEDVTEYCICHQPSYGDMVECDNPKCPYKWFHFACVGLTESPDGAWYCPQCRAEGYGE